MPGRFVRSNLVLADFGAELSHTGPGFRGLWGPGPRASQPCLPLRPFTTGSLSLQPTLGPLSYLMACFLPAPGVTMTSVPLQR